jgi:hypothetical protein
MDLDLRHYIQKPGEWEWADREEKRLEALGKTTLAEMQNAIYNTLMKVPEGKFFDIEASVKPENHEIFIKTVCEFLQYYPIYRFNRLMNKVWHETPIKFKPKEMTPNPKMGDKEKNTNGTQGTKMDT